MKNVASNALPSFTKTDGRIRCLPVARFVLGMVLEVPRKNHKSKTPGYWNGPGILRSD